MLDDKGVKVLGDLRKVLKGKTVSGRVKMVMFESIEVSVFYGYGA